jgi:hypothetical protein
VRRGILAVPGSGPTVDPKDSFYMYFTVVVFVSTCVDVCLC